MLGTGVEFYLLIVVFALPGIALGFTVHELCHALVATSYGDPLPRQQGRLSLNPANQIDPLGLVMLLLIGFGFARPVMYNPFYVRRGRQRAWLAFAGPLSNLLMAAALGVILRLVIALDPSVQSCVLPSFNLPPMGYVYWILTEAFFINVILFIFNMIPIPPLDGYGVAEGLFRGHVPALFQWIDMHRNGIYIVAILAFFLLPSLTSGSVSLGAPITGAADWLWARVVTGEPPIALFPSIEYVLQSSSNVLARILTNPC